MPRIRLDLTKLPPSARRQSIQVLWKPEVIANFIRHSHWTDTHNSVAPELPPTKALVRVFERPHSNGEALAAGYGVVLLPNGKTMHRLLIVHCWSSELEQARKALEIITASYLQQLAGLEVVGDIHLTELLDDVEQPTPRSRSRKTLPETNATIKANADPPNN
jgi:hypothetical protein